jgi:hypothetical protein
LLQIYGGRGRAGAGNLAENERIKQTENIQYMTH